MCGRFTITNDKELIENRFGAKFEDDFFTPRYNAAPSQSLPVILNTEPEIIKPLEWGIRPKWLKQVANKEGLINIRVENLSEKPTFRKDLNSHRCLVLADSFYEWKKTTAKQKTPYRFQLKTGEPFAFAGLWEVNEDEDGQEIETFAIITTESNKLVEKVHNRMPVILPKEQEKVWLESDMRADELISLLKPYPADQMKMYEISNRVNHTAEDVPEIIEPMG